jgi:hypothetical protein
MAPCRSQAQPGRAGVPCGVRAARLTPHHMAAPWAALRAQATRCARLSALGGFGVGATPRGPWTAPRGQDEAAPHKRGAPVRRAFQELLPRSRARGTHATTWRRRGPPRKPKAQKRHLLGGLDELAILSHTGWRARRCSCVLPPVLPWNSGPSWSNLRPTHQPMQLQPTPYTYYSTSTSTSDDRRRLFLPSAHPSYSYHTHTTFTPFGSIYSSVSTVEMLPSRSLATFSQRIIFFSHNKST